MIRGGQNVKLVGSRQTPEIRRDRHRRNHGESSSHVPMDISPISDKDFKYDSQGSSSQERVLQVELKLKTKQPKLLSSKSLSQLIPRSLLFRKNKSQKQEQSIEQNNNANLTTTKSFPNGLAIYANNESMKIMLESTSQQPELVNRLNTASLIALPRQSMDSFFLPHNQFQMSSGNSSSLEDPNLSPITVVGSRVSPKETLGELRVNSTELQAPAPGNKGRIVDEQSENSKSDQSNETKAEAKKKAVKYKALKNTTLVLRDVKNSLSLRMRARRDNQAFDKLTNELTTPPTKLYSPFNIYTPDESDKQQCPTKAGLKTKRKLNLNGNKYKNKPASNGTDDCGPTNKLDKNKSMDAMNETPKNRIALQHKRHLMQANKFTFDSPTGKFRETVKDVERFQQCIEDISKAIRARELQSDRQ